MKKQITLFSVFMIVVIMSFSVSASTSYIDLSNIKDTVVGGVIYSSGSFTTVPGANVAITCEGVTKETVSDSIGVYSVQFTPFQCSLNDVVTVIAKKGDLSGVKTAPVNDYGLTVNLAIVNVPMTPEFGFFFGTLTLISAVGIFFVVRRD